MSRSSDRSHSLAGGLPGPSPGPAPDAAGPSRSRRVAAVQLSARLGDVDANTAACERLAEAAIGDGAEWVMLPEFFTTGVAFLPELATANQPPDGEAAAMMSGLARRHGVTVGGSFLCQDPPHPNHSRLNPAGDVRNAFLLFGPEGQLLGRHDKDLPTMWENCFYVGGSDDGVIDTDDGAAGVALCWELIRSGTARRLRGKVDVVVGGSCWWTIPAWHPRGVFNRMETENERAATLAAPRFARIVGAPVVHAAHCGPIECPMPWTPIKYRGRAEGGASVSDAAGRLLAFRDARQGEGFVIANVAIARQRPAQLIPASFWLRRRGPVPALAWRYQRAHGRRWYARQAGRRQSR